MNDQTAERIFELLCLRDDDGRTPIHIAFENKCENEGTIAKVLSRLNSTQLRMLLEMADKFRMTPVLYAVEKRTKFLLMMEVLQRFDCKSRVEMLGWKHKDFHNVFIKCIHAGRNEIFNVVRECEIEREFFLSRFFHNEMPLQMAIKARNDEAFVLIKNYLESAFDEDELFEIFMTPETSYGMTVFHGVVGSFSRTIESMIEKISTYDREKLKILFRATDKSDDTILHVAIENGNVYAFDIILDVLVKFSREGESNDNHLLKKMTDSCANFRTVIKHCLSHNFMYGLKIFENHNAHDCLPFLFDGKKSAMLIAYYKMECKETGEFFDFVNRVVFKTEQSKTEFQRQFKKIILPTLTGWLRDCPPDHLTYEIRKLFFYLSRIFEPVQIFEIFEDEKLWTLLSFAEILNLYQKIEPNFNFHHLLSLRCNDSFLLKKTLETIKKDVNGNSICRSFEQIARESKEFHANDFH